MADIRKQSSKGREVLLVVYKTSATKDGKGAFVDGLLCDDPHQTNAHLVTTTHKGKNGKTLYSNGQFYTNEQLENLFAPAMASGNFYEEPATDKHSGRLVAKVKADLMPAYNGKGLLINPKTVQPPSKPLDRVELDGVYENMAIARELKAKSEAEAKAAQAQQQAVPQPQQLATSSISSFLTQSQAPSAPVQAPSPQQVAPQPQFAQAPQVPVQGPAQPAPAGTPYTAVPVPQPQTQQASPAQPTQAQQMQLSDYFQYPPTDPAGQQVAADDGPDFS